MSRVFREGVDVRAHVMHTRGMNTNLIASANTRHGFAIGVVRSKACFSVVRMDRASRYVTISNHATEGAARVAANREWAADKGVAR